MKITFIIDNQEHVFTRPFVKEWPNLYGDASIFEMVLFIPGITLEFRYDENNADDSGDEFARWNYFLSSNLVEISEIIIQKNDGETLFWGKLDDKSEPEFDLENGVLKMDFIGLAGDYLDAPLPEDLGYYLNGEEIYLHREIAMTLEQLLWLAFPGFSRHFVDLVPENETAYWLSLKHSDYGDGYELADNYSIGLVKTNIEGKTVLNLLKTLCALGFFRIVFIGKKIYCYSLRESNTAITPDGILYEKGRIIKKKGSFKFTLDVPYFKKMTKTNGSEVWVEITEAIIGVFYGWFDNYSYKEKTLVGLNSNVRAGYYLVDEMKSVLVLSVVRDIAFAENEFQPVEVKIAEFPAFTIPE